MLLIWCVIQHFNCWFLDSSSCNKYFRHEKNNKILLSNYLRDRILCNSDKVRPGSHCAVQSCGSVRSKCFLFSAWKHLRYCLWKWIMKVSFFFHPILPNQSVIINAKQVWLLIVLVAIFLRRYHANNLPRNSSIMSQNLIYNPGSNSCGFTKTICCGHCCKIKYESMHIVFFGFFLKT
jgi:hypothetical protein